MEPAKYGQLSSALASRLKHFFKQTPLLDCTSHTDLSLALRLPYVVAYDGCVCVCAWRIGPENERLHLS